LYCIEDLVNRIEHLVAQGAKLKLREHPLMRYGRLPNWPPVWTQNTRSGVKKLVGEMGVLAYIHARHGPSNKCYLVIDHEHERYVGTLLFDDQMFCGQICHLLRRHIGRSIQEIGDLEVSHFL
jgi:hypothetical protein